MSKENVEIVRRAYDAFERGDLAAVVESVSEDLVTYRDEPDGSTWHGPEGILAAIADWTDGFDEFWARGEEYIDAGDKVIARMHQRATGLSSGVTVEADFWCVHTLRDGKLARYEIYASKPPALKAAGLEA